MKTYYLSNEQMLQNFGAMFENLSKEGDLKTELAEYGYDDAKIAEGKALYDEARKTFDANIKETREETSASLAFQEKYQNVQKKYSTHRKKARIVFEDNEEALRQLKLKGSAARAIAAAMEEMRAFYQLLDTTPNLLTPLKQLKINEEDVKNQLQELPEVEKAYATYLQEKGESQQATRDKNKAFETLDKWVSKFHKVAKIALEDRPQLLEALGKFVRS
ncbi:MULTISPECIES: hypothetical protein [Capnocytophaga]|uniref:Uncharacterized protein n=4 Tax=Capnocytophaga TaxID=1016 RepID=A0A0B7IAF7_9FLAO|nr:MULTISPECIES: hypothetical protein [Capnocytophaga]ATA94147.1 hypothetical protein CGC54_07295 [Capnocytophaga canimorsus]GJQ05415.1 hypothetical protein CAPN009_18300 [Capnocytophaga canimorsus]CEN46883.1 conserved hypothetical protein [Capnocytophaga canis]